MTFNSRVFWRLIAIFAILDACILMAGCGDWESQAISIISLLGPAIQAVIAVLAAFGVGVSADVMTTFQNWATQADNALLTVKGLIQQYKTAAAADQPGLLNEITTALGVISSNLSTILPELHITDANTQARVSAALSAIMGFIAAITALLPAVTAVTSEDEAKALHLKANETVKQFKSEFNGALGYYGKQYEI
jgi:hypothetical protein